MEHSRSPPRELEMNDANLLEAFASYKVKPARRLRSAMTPDGALVISCWYAGFKKAQIEILRYEEDLSGQTTEVARALRAHLAEAMSNESEVRAVVAVETVVAKADPLAIALARMTYYARKDLVGRVSSFDGEPFVVEFRRSQIPVQAKLSKPARGTRRATRSSSDSYSQLLPRRNDRRPDPDGHRLGRIRGKTGKGGRPQVAACCTRRQVR